jgi:hypothetical protein
LVERTLDPYDQSSGPAPERLPERIVLAKVLLATSPSLLVLTRGAKLASLLLRLLVALRDLLLEFGERCVGR